MADQFESWTRRHFLQIGALVAAAPALARNASAKVSAPRRARSSMSADTGGNLRIYLNTGDRFTLLETARIASFAHLSLQPDESITYVLHNVGSHGHRRRGAVSVFHKAATDPRLTWFGTLPLSLSATYPKSAALTASGDALFVAAEGGGIYNVLPVSPDGGLQPVTAIRKEVGTEENGRGRVAAPSHVSRHTDGSIYASDPGQGTVSQFAVSRDSITLLRRARTDAAMGMCSLALPAPLLGV